MFIACSKTKVDEISGKQNLIVKKTDEPRLQGKKTSNKLHTSEGEMSPPEYYSPVAQLVEQAAVNRLVIGSSPIGGALPFRHVNNSTLRPLPKRLFKCDG
tara:strand:- start:118 stop:417 length:300 start_codon:yes stop_codon:yes gene_type:complete